MTIPWNVLWTELSAWRQDFHRHPKFGFKDNRGTVSRPRCRPTVRAHCAPPRGVRVLLVKSLLLFSCCFLLESSAWARDRLGCGTILFPPSSDITSFNPLFTDTIANSQAAELMYPDLFWINRFGHIDWSRSLASAIQVENQGQIYKITLRRWNWSDGVPVTATDVLYDFALIKALGPAATGAGAGGMPGIIESITALDATHLKVVLTQKVNPTWFILNGLVELQPLPAHAWSHYTLDQIFQAQTTPSFFNVVDGPLKLERLDPGSDAVFGLNANYPGPKMHFSRFVFEFIESDGSSIQQIEAGDVDLTPLPTQFYNSIRNTPGIHVERLAPENGSYMLQMNFQNPQVAFFKDLRVRQAIEDAQDQQSLIKTVLHGFGTPTYTAVPPGENAFLAPQLASGDYPVGYDLAKARALLKQAGYRPGPDGIMQKDGKKLEFTDLMSTGSDEFTEMTEFIQSNLRAVGIQMDVRAMDSNQIGALMGGNPFGWQASIEGFYPSDYPSGDSQYISNAANNPEGYSDPEMDRLINDSMYKPGLENLYDYESYASAQQPSIFTISWAQVYLVSNRLHGVNDFIDPAGQLAPDQLYCIDER